MGTKKRNSALHAVIIFLLSMVLGSFTAATAGHFPIVAQVVWAPGALLTEYLYPGAGMDDPDAINILTTAFAANSLYLGLTIFGLWKVILYYRGRHL
jgi:uncharacterized membrane protein (DUF2068 family)